MNMSIPDINELIEIGQKIISKAKELGASEAEVYLSATNRFSLRIITNYVTTISGLDSGMGIRVAIGKSVGFSSTSSLDLEKGFETLKTAVKIAKTRPPDPDFKHFANPKSGGKSGIFDENLANVPEKELVEISGKSVKEGFEESKYAKKIDFGLGRYVGSFAIVNSRGIENGDRYTAIFAWASVKSVKNDETVTGEYSVISRTYIPDNILRVSAIAGKRSERMFGGKKLEKQTTGQLLIENHAVTDFLWPLTYNVSALNVQNGRSKFIGKLDSKIATQDVTIYDDGTLPIGIRTAKIDDEGVPTSKKPIIEKGILKTYLYDSYTAHKDNRESTGNGIRSNYESIPSPGAINIVIEKTCEKDVNELIREIDKGVFVSGFTMGSHLTDPLKGSFSITSLNAFYVENGDILYPLKSVSASGNFFELLNNIDKIGNDHKLTFTGYIPSILANNIVFI